MKTLFAFFILTIVFSIQNSSAQATTSKHQMFTCNENIQSIYIDLDASNVDIQTTQGSRIMVETTANVNVANPKLADFLARQGRYDLVAMDDATTGKLTLAPKKNNNVLMVQGQECTETITYIIYVPQKIELVELRGTSVL